MLFCLFIFCPCVMFPTVSPVPTISWRRADAASFGRKVDVNKASGVLEIPYFQLEDAGVYECVAENSRGRNSVKGKLSFYGECEEGFSLALIENSPSFKPFCVTLYWSLSWIKKKGVGVMAVTIAMQKKKSGHLCARQLFFSTIHTHHIKDNWYSFSLYFNYCFTSDSLSTVPAANVRHRFISPFREMWFFFTLVTNNSSSREVNGSWWRSFMVSLSIISPFMHWRCLPTGPQRLALDWNHQI